LLPDGNGANVFSLGVLEFDGEGSFNFGRAGKGEKQQSDDGG
jgi:hypothetical protein